MNYTTLLEKAIAIRTPRLATTHENAFRLFNGFYEGAPDFVVDVYARTLLVHNYADDPAQNQAQIISAVEYLKSTLNWLRAGVIKTRNGRTQTEKRGQLLFGEKPDTYICEHETRYALNLTMNRDAGFYLDTEYLRKWLLENVKGKDVLNTFAYTGSLGVAALKGGASRVVQVDVNRSFLNIAGQSYALNGFPIQKGDLIPRDFFEQVGSFKRAGQLFDCVIVDPPFFSTTAKGTVNQFHESARVINKVRPLIRDGGLLVTINNALFVSGQEYMRTLDGLCKDGYLGIRELIPVPDDFIGRAINPPVTDPAPFNHSTKIVALNIRRK